MNANAGKIATNAIRDDLCSSTSGVWILRKFKVPFERLRPARVSKKAPFLASAVANSDSMR
ncbi:hypothetical protein D3C72_1860160 [compost metagenome]